MLKYIKLFLNATEPEKVKNPILINLEKARDNPSKWTVGNILKNNNKVSEKNGTELEEQKDKENNEKKMPKDLKMSKQGAKELAKYESFKQFPYDDKNPKAKNNKYIPGRSTIGYGHLIKSQKEFEKYQNGISKEDALKLYQKDIEDHSKAVKEYIKVPLTQKQYDALVMREYNSGSGGFTDTGKTRSKEMTNYINSGKDLDTKEFAEIYQARSYSKTGYMKGIENRRIKELDYMNDKEINESESYLKKRRIYDKKK